MITSLMNRPIFKPKNDPIVGYCSVCSKRHSLPVRVWRVARQRDSWPICSTCENWVYPEKRTCKTCCATLRSGNLGDHCAICERKTVPSHAL